MNLSLTNFLIKYPKFDFIKNCLNQLDYINLNLHIYKYRNTCFLYIGKNKEKYLLLYGAYSNYYDRDKLVLMFSGWYSKKSVIVENDYVKFDKLIYKRMSEFPSDYIVLER